MGGWNFCFGFMDFLHGSMSIFSGKTVVGCGPFIDGINWVYCISHCFPFKRPNVMKDNRAEDLNMSSGELLEFLVKEVNLDQRNATNNLDLVRITELRK